MDLFRVPEYSPGCPEIYPNGMVVRNGLENYIKEVMSEYGWDNEVKTPELNKVEIWEETGHLEAFDEEKDMFAWEQNGKQYGLKPMSCANHANMFDGKHWSYRDLPVRFAESGNVYRNEQSGELSGLLRVRRFTQDDGHGFVREEQVGEEVANVIKSIEQVYETFDLPTSYKLETRGENSIGTDEEWERATQALINALEENDNIDGYTEEEGEAAFYGPKIGVDVEDSLGREWTVGTVQVDFNIPRELDLSYDAEGESEKRPAMIHRAILGSYERFMGIITEHYQGRFPTWLSPEQGRVIPVNDGVEDYAEEVAHELDGFRVTVDDGKDHFMDKIGNAHDMNVPYMFIVGPDEKAHDDKVVSLRDRQERESEDVAKLDRVEAILSDEVGSRSNQLTLLNEIAQERQNSQ